MIIVVIVLNIIRITMSLILNLSYEESADKTQIVLRDTSTGWGTDGDPGIAAIDVATITFTLDTEVNIVAVISVFTASGGDQDLLVFTLDAGDLGGTSGEEIVDAVYLLDYSVDTAPSTGPWDMTSKIAPIIGFVMVIVYEGLINAPDAIASMTLLNEYKDQDWEDIVRPLVDYAHYEALFATDDEARILYVTNIFVALQNRLNSLS